MFHLTRSPNFSNVFEGFCILKRCEEVKCLYSFPSNYTCQTFYEYIFPCNCPKNKSEEYCIVTSNASNDRSFLLCRYSKEYQLYLCVYSHYPWFEIFSKLLFNLSHDEFMPNKFKRIESYLIEVSKAISGNQIILPSCNANDKNPQILLICSLNYPYMYDKYIQEYLTAIDPSAGYKKKLWLEIFWSMLLERPIIFMSKRYQKLTSSLLAATFFIHPLSWLHKFISIIPQKSPQLLGTNCCMLGIHSCMEPIIEKTEFWNEALLVDLDKGSSFMVGACDNEKETKSRFKIPKYIKKFFISHIDMIDDSVSSSSYLKIEGLISTTPWYMNKEETMYNEYKKGFHVYSLLFRTIVSMLIGNYRQFIYCNNGHYKFDRDKFVLSDSKLSAFLKILVQSQCFSCFIDEKVQCIENGSDMDDRFDGERQEVQIINKVKCKEHKRKKTHKTEKNPKSTSQLSSRSLSSSTSSINSNLSFDNGNINITTNNDKSLKGLKEKTELNYLSQLSVNSTNTIGEEDDTLLTPICSKHATFKIKSATCMPSSDKVTLRQTENPPGKVLNIVQQINQGNLEDNVVINNNKKFIPQINSAKFPNNTISKLTSFFEQKPV